MMSQPKDKGSTILSNLVKMPLMFQEFKHSNIEYTLRDLQTLLKAKNPEQNLKQDLLETLNKASSKEEFSTATSLLLSLHNQTMTIPLNYENFFSVLQFKKRYNKKTKKIQLDFYAALELLGPISGVLILDINEIVVELNVAFEKTKNFLENDMDNISYNVNINILEDIQPLYNLKQNSLLDINI